MHGRPRLPKGQLPDPEKVKQQEQKAALFGKLLREVMDRRNSHRMDEESMALCAKLLELNPEVCTGWNYRREFLEPILAAGGAEALRWIETELQLTLKSLQRNPKSYHTWHHRKWIVAKRMSSINQELELVSTLLNVDERNFHAWTYRRFLSALQGLTPDAELAFSKLKIDQNFSNYSAWHYRTSLLPQIHDPLREDAADSLGVLLSQLAHVGGAEGGAGDDAAAAEEGGAEEGRAQTAAAGQMSQTAAAAAAPGRVAPAACIPLAVLEEELELVRQAFFTEPNDQSCWFYQRWLLGALMGKLDPGFKSGESERPDELRERVTAALEREAGCCAELLEIEPNCKWAMLARAHTLGLLDSMGARGSRRPEIRELLERLAVIDSDRAGYYKDRLKSLQL